ncbi:hypothetical protein V1514DRAFT_326226 [Lipomyces japonicus]|uniref:uncharacterized protein n=1 Tax=Lipomyces japonicus TaxID=56871 RepID=UPI0034CF48E1
MAKRRRTLSSSLPLTAELNLQQFVARDALQAAAFKDHTDRHIAFLRLKRKQIEYYDDAVRPVRAVNPGTVFGEGYIFNGNGAASAASATGGPLGIPLGGPSGSANNTHNRRRLKLSRAEVAAVAETPENLVPIRLDFEFDQGGTGNGVKLRDTFTWNAHDSSIPPDLFAETLCLDYELPLAHAPQISRAITDQLADNAIVPPPQQEPSASTSTSTSTSGVPYTTFKDDGLRVVIKLDITIGHQNLVDQFEWDINHPANDPEQFAASLCTDLSLPAEFVTAVAHAIREQAQLFTKSLLLVGHQFDGSPVDDDDLRAEICPALVSQDALVRPAHQIREFTPALYFLSDAEIAKFDRDSERENRYKRRQGRATTGRRTHHHSSTSIYHHHNSNSSTANSNSHYNNYSGIVLPDLRDPMRTFRTPIINSVLPGAIPRRAPDFLQPEKDNEKDTSDEPVAKRRFQVHSTDKIHTNAAANSQSNRHVTSADGRLVVKLKGPKIKAFLLNQQSKQQRQQPLQQKQQPLQRQRHDTSDNSDNSDDGIDSYNSDEDDDEDE